MRSCTADPGPSYDIAIERGLEVVYPLTDEKWGVRRFFVTDPDGLVLNVMSHRTPTKESVRPAIGPLQ